MIEPFEVSDFVPYPTSCVVKSVTNVLRNILDVLDCIVKVILRTVFGAVIIVLDVLGYVFDLSDLGGQGISTHYSL